MAAVSAQVTWVAESGEVMFSIDRPVGVVEGDALSFVCAGWVHGRTEPIESVAILAAGDRVTTLPLQPRSDVTEYLAGQGIDTNGIGTAFHARISVVGFAPETDVKVTAWLADGKTLDLAVIHVTRTRTATAIEPKFQPLLVLSTGRSGSTWLMDLIRHHPGVVVQGAHPYELRAAHYWMHLVRSLSEEPVADEPPEAFIERSSNVTPFPYAIRGTPTDDFASTPGHVRALVNYAQSAIDDFYRLVARLNDKNQPRYFAEKAWFAGFMPGVFSEVYPGTRNVFLLRDPRDAVASVLAFNRQRGWDDFGRSGVNTDEDYAADLTRYVLHGLAISESMPTSLVVRYEDLVRSPADELRRLFEYCELDARPGTIASMIDAAEAAASIPVDHRTSRSGPDSIGRWRSELSPSVREAIEATMGDALRRLGYES